MKELIIKKGDKQITVADKEDVMDALDGKSDNTHNHDSTYIKKTGGVSQHSSGNIIIPSALDTSANDATGKIPFAGHLVSSTYSIEDFTTQLKSFIGGLKDKDNRWWNVISARQTNGGGSEAESNGLIFKSILDLNSNLLWNKQRNGTWGTEKTILDSSNYSTYASPTNHTHKDEDLLYNSSTQDKLTPLDMAFVSNTNKLAYLPASRIQIWTTSDNGSTWNKNVGTNAQKINLVTTQTDALAAGNGSTANYGQNQIRVSLTFGDVNQNSILYATVSKLLLRVGTHGALGATVTVYIRKYNTSSYTQIGTFNVNGWTGWNAIPLTGTIGGYASQTTGSGNNIQEIILHFKQNSSSTGNLKVYEIKMVGEKIYNGPSQLGKTGHLYDMNENQDAIFPNKIIKYGGTSSQVLKANGDVGTVVNDLTTGGTDSVLSAEQGKTLKSLVDGKITNGTGTVTSTNIADKTIVNGDIADNAAIAYSKLSGVVSSTDTRLTNKRAPINNEIAANSNLNNFINAGFYYCQGDAEIAPTIVNQPLTSGNQRSFSMIVELMSSTRVVQKLTYYSTKDTYIRTNINGEWSTWNRVLHSGNYSNYANKTTIADNLTTSAAGSALDARQGKWLYDNKAPTSHATTATTYGGGTASNYGHVKLSDAYTSSGGAASASVGASSKAVADAYSTLNTNKADKSNYVAVVVKDANGNNTTYNFITK